MNMSLFNGISFLAWCRGCFSPTEISYTPLEETSVSESESKSESELETSFIEVQPPVLRVYTTSWILRKHATFMSQTQMNTLLSVRELPGIEETLGERLSDGGIKYAHQLLRVYTSCLADRDIFYRWMEKRFGATLYETLLICYALDTWWFAICESP